MTGPFGRPPPQPATTSRRSDTGVRPRCRRCSSAMPRVRWSNTSSGAARRSAGPVPAPGSRRGAVGSRTSAPRRTTRSRPAHRRAEARPCARFAWSARRARQRLAQRAQRSCWSRGTPWSLAARPQAVARRKPAVPASPKPMNSSSRGARRPRRFSSGKAGLEGLQLHEGGDRRVRSPAMSNGGFILAGFTSVVAKHKDPSRRCGDGSWVTNLRVIGSLLVFRLALRRASTAPNALLQEWRHQRYGMVGAGRFMRRDYRRTGVNRQAGRAVEFPASTMRSALRPRRGAAAPRSGAPGTARPPRHGRSPATRRNHPDPIRVPGRRGASGSGWHRVPTRAMRRGNNRPPPSQGRRMLEQNRSLAFHPGSRPPRPISRPIPASRPRRSCPAGRRWNAAAARAVRGEPRRDARPVRAARAGDYGLPKSMPDASPWWHLAHTTWFYEVPAARARAWARAVRRRPIARCSTLLPVGRRRVRRPDRGKLSRPRSPRCCAIAVVEGASRACSTTSTTPRALRVARGGDRRPGPPRHRPRAAAPGVDPHRPEACIRAEPAASGLSAP